MTRLGFLLACVLMLAACGSDRAPLGGEGATPSSAAANGCVCPGKDVTVPLPDEAVGRPVDVHGQTCSARYDAASNSVVVDGASGTAGGCLISAAYAGGSVYQAEVSFGYRGRACGWRATGETTGFGTNLADACRVGVVITTTQVALPAEVKGRVSDVTWDASCDVAYVAATNSITVSGIARASACTIVVSLADETALSATATFGKLVNSSCGSFYYATTVPVSAFQPVATGAPACSR